MKPVVVDDRAEAELEEQVVFHNQREDGLGRDLRFEVETTLALIGENPAIGSFYKKTEFRFFTGKRFPFVIYYREHENFIWVIAIAHGSRRPGYWRTRRMR